MATYEVSTWAELVAKLSMNTMESRTIKLTADIDCNDAIPTGVGSTITIYNSGDYPVVIDGSYTENDVVKNHVIRNLRTNITSPVGIFNLARYSSQSSGNRNTNVTFKNIDFINLILDGASFINNADSGYVSNNKLTFNKCRFVGRRNRFLVNAKTFESSSGNALTFTSCFFNMDYTGTENTYMPLNGEWKYSSNYFATANYCRIKQSYTGWNIGSAADPYNALQNITHNLNLNGCYLYGTFVGTGNTSGARINISSRYSYNATIQNVVDADLRLDGTSTAGMSCSVVAPKGIFVNRIRKLNNDSVTYVTSNYNASGNAKAIPISPEDMTNPQALYDAGFDIVVPE